MLDFPDLFVGRETSVFGIHTTILTVHVHVSSGIPKAVKVTNIQYVLRNERLDCYGLLHADRLI